VFTNDNNATVYYLVETTGWGPTFGGRPTVPSDLNCKTNNSAITITGYTGSGGAVTIPGTVNLLPVTSIGTNAFYGCTNLTSVTIGNSVTSIESFAFFNCYSLTGVYFKGNAPSLGSSVFSGDNNATVYYLVETTGWGPTFGGRPTAPSDLNYKTNNSAITITGYTGSGGAVTIPGTVNLLPVTSIGDGAFALCTSLTSVTITNSVTSIGNYAFYVCTSLTNVTLGNSITNIGTSAFNDCVGLTSVTIPNSVTSIGSSAFQSCWSLTSVTIGNGVTSIGIGAFVGCTGLTNVMIPYSVTGIGAGAFNDCTSLTAITVAPTNSVYSSVAGVLFNKSQTTLIQCPGGKAGSYTIPNGVTSIGSAAFEYCASLTSVTIPNSVTSIGDGAFMNCTSLTGVYFKGNAPSLGSSVFSDDDNATVYYLVETTGWGPTFGGLPTAPWDLNYTNNNGAITITGYTGSGGAVTIPGTINLLPVTSIGTNAFSNCTNLTSVTIPNSVTNIGNGAFAFCSSLASVTISNGVTNIGDGAFVVCYSLTNVTIPNSVTSIGNDAFSWCTSLTSVTIGNSVTNIESFAFFNCYSLTGVYFLGCPPSLGPSVFYGDPNVIIYYLRGTTCWGTTFGGLPTWNPQVQTGDANFGVRTNRFGFTVTGNSNLVIVVEACTNLANPTWSPVGTNTLTGGSSYFSDPQWTNYRARFYRLRSP
jgi:hypothetical protein